MRVVLRHFFRLVFAWQVQAVSMLLVIGLLLLFLGQHDDPYEIILKQEKERHSALMNLRFSLDLPEEEEVAKIKNQGIQPNVNLNSKNVAPSDFFPKPKYDHTIGVERSFGYLYMDTSKVFYNRVPKAGSRSILRMLTILQRINGFQLIQSKNYLNYSISATEEYTIVRNVTMHEGPVIFERHLHFVDFTRYNAEQPIYINMVQEPATRLASWYYFIRFNKGHIREMPDSDRYRTYDECVRLDLDECTSVERTFQMIPFFCGQDAFCRKPCVRALEQAKQNVERYYAVVGVVDDFKGFLSVLEVLLPTYFANSVRVYEEREESERRYSATLNKREPSMATKRTLSLKLKYEYEFYYYIKQRFYRLLYLVNKMRINRLNQDILGIS